MQVRNRSQKHAQRTRKHKASSTDYDDLNAGRLKFESSNLNVHREDLPIFNIKAAVHGRQAPARELQCRHHCQRRTIVQQLALCSYRCRQLPRGRSVGENEWRHD